MIKHISNIKNMYGAKHATQQPRVMDFHVYTIFATAQMLHTISFYITCNFCAAEKLYAIFIFKNIAIS